MGDPAGHLPNELHFLRLLKRSLSLLSLCNLCLQLVVFFFQLLRAFPDQIFQLRGPLLSLKEVVLDLILPAARPQRRFRGAYKRNSPEGPL